MPGRVVSRRFVGRERELARLESMLAAAMVGPATTLVVAGTAGIGVSRFVDEGLGRLATSSPGALILRGTAHGPVDTPWAALLAAIQPLIESRPPEELSSLLAADARPPLALVPALGPLARRVPARSASALADTERRQPRALEALMRWLGRIAAERPVALVLEDLHVADAATRAFATFVARVAREERIGLVLTYQPDRLTREHPLWGSLAEIEAGPRPAARIDLRPLSGRDVAGLIEGIEGERPSASVVVSVAERSSGLPLVVEEVMAARRDLRIATLTGSLEDLVTARLARRGPECRRALRLLACAGRPLSRERLAVAAAAFESEGQLRPPPRSSTRPRHDVGALDGDLAAGLEEAIDHGFVHVWPDGTVGIRHELLARAVVSDLLSPQRPRYRAAAAVAFADAPAIAAAHWRAAHRLPEARAAWVAAAETAGSAAAPEDALAALEGALELGPAPGSDEDAAPVVGADDTLDRETIPRLMDLERLAAEHALAARRPTRAVAYADAALASLGERRDRVEHALLEARLGQYRLAAGDNDGAARALRRAVEVLPAVATLDRARVLALCAQERMIAGAFRAAERLATAALDVCRQLGDQAAAEAVHATTTLGVVLGWGGRAAEGVALLESALADARALELPDERFRASANLTTVLDLLGRRDEAVAVAYRGIEEARALDLQAVYGNFLGANAADTLFSLGRWEESREMSLRALDWSAPGVSLVSAIVNLLIVEIESRAGEEASRLLGRILVELFAGRDAQFAVDAAKATASLALWSGDLADARRASERGWAGVHGSEDWAIVARMAAVALEVEAALVAAALDDRKIADVAAARGRAAQVLAAADAAVRAGGVDEALGSRREAEAHLAVARAFHARLDGQDDPATWGAIADQWRALGDRYRVAKARWRQAEAFLALAGAGPPGSRGERADARVVRADAREPLVESAEIALALGARPLLRELRELGRRALITLPDGVAEFLDAPAPIAEPVPDRRMGPPPEPLEPVEARTGAGKPAQASSDTFGLSRRELEVLGLIAQGRTNREIGDRLFISQKTVGVHVGNILAKLGVSGRVEAATVAIRLGLGEGRVRG